jgi:hypothetical protein
MGAPLGFKTFATGDVLTAADTNGYLMQGVWVFADAAARTAAVTSPQEGNYSYLKSDDKTYYYNGTAWTALGGGKVLQVVNAIYGTETSTASSTYADTGLTATITPSLSTSKVLALVTMPFYKDISNTNGEFKLIRTATTIATLSNIAYNGAATGLDIGTVSINYLDSPATTSATTYKVQFCSQANSSRVIINRAGGQTNQSSMTLMEIGA